MEIVCVQCGGPREVEQELRPGEVKYKPCVTCGALGIRRAGDLYQQVRNKKPVREPYHKSRYRGGKLMGP